MATTVGQCVARARRYLGVKSTDPRYTPELLLDEYNTAIGQLHDDCLRLNEDILAVDVTLAVENGQVSLAGQSTPILDLTRLIELRDDTEQGAPRDEVPYADLQAYPALTYAITGAPGALSLRFPRNGAPAACWMRYIPGPPTATSTDDVVPAWIEDRFVDVPAMLVAVQTFPMGGEEQTPGELAGRLEMRLSMLWQAWSTRSRTLMRRRPRGEGQAPYIFS